MNRTEYMEELKKCLRRLPKEDFDKAMDYYEEYFADAGAENEAQVIEDLGTPDFAARQIITNIAINNTKETAGRDVKKGLNGVWVGVLAILAAPFALPMVLLCAVFILLLVLTILMLIAAFFLTGILFVLAGPMCIISAFTVIAADAPAFIASIGIGLTSIGAGLLLCFGMIRFCQWFLNGTIQFCGHLVKRKNTKEEEI